MAVSDTKRNGSPLHVFFPINAIFITVASLPLIFAYPEVFARLGIPSLENGFFVQLSGVWLFTEAIASLLVWQHPRANVGTVWVIIAMKVVFIALVVVAYTAGTLPASAFLIGAAVDLILSVIFLLYLRDVAPSAS
jgi:hypothetical protein